MAANILATCNTNNRAMNKTRVKNYAKLMKAGLWKTSDSDICIDWDGNLGTGQHRLQAVVESGVSVWLTFKLDTDPADTAYFDQSSQKTLANVLQIQNVKNPKLKAPSYLALRTIAEVNTSRGDIEVFTRFKSLDAYMDSFIAIAVKEKADRIYKEGGIFGTLAFCALHFGLAPTLKFYEDVVTGAGLSKNSAALSYKNWLIRNKSKSIGGTRSIRTLEHIHHALYYIEAAATSTKKPAKYTEARGILTFDKIRLELNKVL